MNLSKEAVKEVVDSGCTISLPYKVKIDDYFSEIKLNGDSSYYNIIGAGGVHFFNKTFDEIWVEFSKFFNNIGIIFKEIVVENPDLCLDCSSEDWLKVKRLVFQRARDIRAKGIKFGRRKSAAKPRRNSCYGGRASQLKDVEEYYQTKKDGKVYGRKLK